MPSRLPARSPQSDVQHAVAHVVVGAQLPLQVIVDLLAPVRVAPEQQRRQHHRLGEGRGRAHPVRDVLAAGAVVAADPHREPGGGQRGALDVGHVADAGGGLLQPDVGNLERKLANLDTVDPAHDGSDSAPNHARLPPASGGQAGWAPRD